MNPVFRQGPAADRDVALQSSRRIVVGVAAGGVGLAAAISVLAAVTHPGRAAASSPAGQDQAQPAPGDLTPQQPSGDGGLAAPAAPPQDGGGQAPMVVTGSS